MPHIKRLKNVNVPVFQRQQGPVRALEVDVVGRVKEGDEA